MCFGAMAIQALVKLKRFSSAWCDYFSATKRRALGGLAISPERWRSKQVPRSFAQWLGSEQQETCVHRPASSTRVSRSVLAGSSPISRGYLPSTSLGTGHEASAILTNRG